MQDASQQVETLVAAPESRSAKPRERITHIVFRLEDKKFAVEMSRLHELDRMTPITPVPNTPDFILGVTNLRGEIVSVIDLRRLFGLQPMDRPDTGRLLKLSDRRALVVSGVLVDSIQGARTIKADKVRRTKGAPDKWSRVLEGVYQEGDETLHVLDVDKLFESEELRTLTGA